MTEEARCSVNGAYLHPVPSSAEQALALGNGTALKIAKELISQKLAAQELLVRDMLHDSAAADAIARFRDELSSADSIEVVRRGASCTLLLVIVE